MALYAIRFGEARGISRFIESATKIATWEMELLSAPVLYSPECVEGKFLEVRAPSDDRASRRSASQLTGALSGIIILDGGACVGPYLGTIELEYQVRVAVSH
jgi:hypothetical protein